MGTKGDVKVLDVKAAEKAIFVTKRFLMEGSSEITNIESEIRKLKDGEIANLAGGQGTLILETLDSTEKFCIGLKDSLNKIQKVMNEKLEKMIEQYKDKTNLGEAVDKAKAAANNSSLRRQ